MEGENISFSYETLWKFIIRPPRDDYTEPMLGSPDFSFKGKKYKIKRKNLKLRGKEEEDENGKIIKDFGEGFDKRDAFSGKECLNLLFRFVNIVGPGIKQNSDLGYVRHAHQRSWGLAPAPAQNCIYL